MTREEMLTKLHGIHVGVSFVALTSEGALECTCVTPVGTSYEWLDLYNWDWPAYRIVLPSDADMHIIKDKLCRGLLRLIDIVGTEFEPLYNNCISEEDRNDKRLNVFFSGLASFTAPGDSKVYALYDNEAVHFFEEYEELEKAFSEFWGVTPWEDCADEVLIDMIEQIEEGFDRIPLTSFGDEESEDKSLSS